MSVYGSPFGDFCSRTTIPYFSGEHVEWWIYHVECFFYHHQIIPDQKFSWVEVYFIDEALQWYREWIWDTQRSWRRVTWEDFVIDLKKRFKVRETSHSWNEELDFVKTKLNEIQHLLSKMQASHSTYLSNLSKLRSQMALNSISKLTSTAKESLEAVNECSYEVAPQMDDYNDVHLHLVTKDTSTVINEEPNDAKKEMAATQKLLELKLAENIVLEPIIYQTPTFPREVHSSHFVVNLHDDVEYVIGNGCTKYGIVASSKVLGISSVFCTAGVCGNVYEAFSNLKMICLLFQRQNIHMVVNDVSFLLDWVEKPPPFPPDLTHDAIIYKTLQASGEEDHDFRLLRLSDISIVLCLKECIPVSGTKAIESFLLLFVCAQPMVTITANGRTHRTKIAPVKCQKLAESSHLMDSVGHCTCQCTMVYAARGQQMHDFFALGPLQFLVFFIPNSKVEGLYQLPSPLVFSSIQWSEIWSKFIFRAEGTITTELFQTFIHRNPMKLMMPLPENDWHLSRSIGSHTVRFIGSGLGAQCMREDYRKSCIYWSPNFRHWWELGSLSIDPIIVHMINATIVLWFSREMAMQEIVLTSQRDEDIIKVPSNGVAQYFGVLYCESLEFFKEIQQLDSPLSHFLMLQGNVLIFYSYIPKGARSYQHVVMETEMNNWWVFHGEDVVVLLYGFLIKPATFSIYFRFGLELGIRAHLVVVLHNSDQGIIWCLYQLLYTWILRGLGDMTACLTLLVIGLRYKCLDGDREQQGGYGTKYDLLNIVITVWDTQDIFFNFCSSRTMLPYPSSLWNLFAQFLHKLHNDKDFSVTILNQKRTIHFSSLLATFSMDLGVLKHLVDATQIPSSDNVQRTPSQQASFVSAPHSNIHASVNLLSSEFLLMEKGPNKLNGVVLELFHLDVLVITTQRRWYQYLEYNLLVTLIALSNFIIGIFVFSSPRPPEIVDLEDKVILKVGVMIRASMREIMLCSNLKGLFRLTGTFGTIL